MKKAFSISANFRPLFRNPDSSFFFLLTQYPVHFSKKKMRNGKPNYYYLLLLLFWSRKINSFRLFRITHFGINWSTWSETKRVNKTSLSQSCVSQLAKLMQVLNNTPCWYFIERKIQFKQVRRFPTKWPDKECNLVILQIQSFKHWTFATTIYCWW